MLVQKLVTHWSLSFIGIQSFLILYIYKIVWVCEDWCEYTHIVISDLQHDFLLHFEYFEEECSDGLSHSIYTVTMISIFVGLDLFYKTIF